jgi:DNA-binding NarL/FixJ family response regulator
MNNLVETPAGCNRRAFVFTMQDTKPIRIMIADDSEVTRHVITSVAAKTPDIELVAAASYGAEAVRLYRQHQPDIVLMDFAMPVMNGLEAIREICRDFPQARIIYYSVHFNNLMRQFALEAGAVGCLDKGSTLPELLRAIRNVYNGLPIDWVVHLEQGTGASNRMIE